MSESPTHPDLDWLAFQYVTDGLPDGERERFETQLLDCQATREAVARAVELTLAAEFVCRAKGAEAVSPAAAGRADFSRSDAPWRRWRWQRVGWAAMAASLAFVVGWQASLWFVSNPRPGPLASDVAGKASLPVPLALRSEESGSGRELALAWTQTRRTLSLPEFRAELPLADDLREAEAPLADDHAEAALYDVQTPSWMLAAVAGMRGAADGESSAEESEEAPLPREPAAIRHNEG